MKQLIECVPNISEGNDTKKINEIVKNPRISAICYGNPLCYQEHAISEIRSKVYPNLLRNHKLL